MTATAASASTASAATVAAATAAAAVAGGSALHRLLDSSLERSPVFGPGFASHLPMALHALDALGADAARLQAFFDHYARRLKPHAGGAPPLADWASALGRSEAFDALRATFALHLRERGVEATLRAALPVLWPGVVAAAFHGLIRTAHAVQAGHAGELAAALAYWAASFRRLPDAPARAMDFASWSRALQAAALATRAPGGSIVHAIEAVVPTPAWRELAGALPSGAATLRDLADWAAAHYADSGSFTVLHMVTGCRAARVLLAHADKPALAWPHLVRAFVGAALASQLGHPRAAPPELTWAEARQRAIAADDDHVIKLVHACVEDSAAYGEDGPRLRAAARALA
jgi:hypothetical protein